MAESSTWRSMLSFLQLPQASGTLFQFPPATDPFALESPRRPYSISANFYREALSVKYPLVFALVYIVLVVFTNHYNASRGRKPWAIKQSRLFLPAVILHNVLLAVYSAWTFLGMLRAIRIAWPGWAPEDPQNLTRIVDAFCKVSGPQGLHNAAVYIPADDRWFIPNPLASAIGRLWDEGLGFYGWIFYLSKFYEVVDTLIILATGKTAKLLQVYHHAGAMLGMWAGIRYRSPPIWLFVFLNSGIHALMYTYYTLAALRIRVPLSLKKQLTTLQITQFLVGLTYAVLHLFVGYQLPVKKSVYTVHQSGASSTAVVPGLGSSASDPTTSADWSAWAKAIALRAAGFKTMPASDRIPQDVAMPSSGSLSHPAGAADSVNWTTEYMPVSCLDTSGQAFAIWFNGVYLVILTILFGLFYIKAYFSGPEKKTLKYTQPKTWWTPCRPPAPHRATHMEWRIEYRTVHVEPSGEKRYEKYDASGESQGEDRCGSEQDVVRANGHASKPKGMHMNGSAGF